MTKIFGKPIFSYLAACLGHKTGSGLKKKENLSEEVPIWILFWYNKTISLPCGSRNHPSPEFTAQEDSEGDMDFLGRKKHAEKKSEKEQRENQKGNYVP